MVHPRLVVCDTSIHLLGLILHVNQFGSCIFLIKYVDEGVPSKLVSNFRKKRSLNYKAGGGRGFQRDFFL